LFLLVFLCFEFFLDFFQLHPFPFDFILFLYQIRYLFTWFFYPFPVFFFQIYLSTFFFSDFVLIF
jgi:hypothetical protein